MSAVQVWCRRQAAGRCGGMLDGSRRALLVLVVLCAAATCLSQDPEGTKGNVLVLGSGGLVGRSLVALLEKEGYHILHVRNREHIDLRVPGALDVFNSTRVDYCFFLACEVGGSKFIESSEQDTQVGIIDSNLRIYQTVLPYLNARAIPFAFTSSYLQGTENSYGVVKRLGEQWVRNLNGLGRTLRLWNVYGAEAIGPKSHVLSDWAQQCAARHQAASLTDGTEERQFVHVEDVSAALLTSMLHHHSLHTTSDVSSGEWVDMRAAAAALEAAADHSCAIHFTHTAAAYRARLSPDMHSTLHQHWKPAVSLHQGCRMLLEEYRRRLHCETQDAFCSAEANKLGSSEEL